MRVVWALHVAVKIQDTHWAVPCSVECITWPKSGPASLPHLQQGRLMTVLFNESTMVRLLLMHCVVFTAAHTALFALATQPGFGCLDAASAVASGCAGALSLRRTCSKAAWWCGWAACPARPPASSRASAAAPPLPCRYALISTAGLWPCALHVPV